MLFLLGGIAGTVFALRWSHRMGGVRPSVERVQAVLDDTVMGVEAAAASVRAFVAPLHDILDEAGAIATRVDRTVGAYREIGRQPEPIAVAPDVPVSGSARPS
jgi:hypothetical protein